jgi:hypothetical protein
MLHISTFEYLKPTDKQLNDMGAMREAFAVFVKFVENSLPDGADKTYVIRHLREAAMWANVSITREADGTPRIS